MSSALDNSRHDVAVLQSCKLCVVHAGMHVYIHC